MASDQMVVAALGRSFTLGMLYDARKDELVPGFPMWDPQTLKGMIQTSSQRSSKSHITSSDSTAEKSSLLDVEASVKLSFLSGLVEVGGSAKYLNDQKKFQNQSRVTFQYKVTTHFQQLLLTSASDKAVQNTDIIEKGLATHVVTGILYGADAFFVFDSEKVEASEVQDLQGQMEAVIKKIPGFDIEGQAKIHLSDEEKALVNKFSCKFYGDLILESNPATFDQAVSSYVQLPKLLGGDGQNTVPVKVWLMPLKYFDTKATELKTGITVGTVITAESTLDDLRNLQMRCNDSLNDSILGKFPQIHSQMSTFQKLCHYYTLELQRNMAKMCPAIREGKEDESQLKKLFNDRDTSPFRHDNLSKWLDNKEREINVIRACVNLQTGVPIMSTQSEVDRFVLGQPLSVGYIFTSLTSSDSVLDGMKSYLEAMKVGKTEYVEEASDAPWYYEDDVVSNMMQGAKKMAKVAHRCLFIATIQNEKYPGAAAYTYVNGKLVQIYAFPLKASGFSLGL